MQEPDTFICVTSKVDTATELVKNSPLRFKFISEPLESIRAKSAPGTQYTSVAALIEIHEEEDVHGRDHERPSKPELAQSELIRTFKVHINPSNDYYDHRTTIRRNPLFGPWPQTLDEDQDSIYFALKNVVPDNIARKALCDWNTGGQLSEDAQILRASDGKLAKDWAVYERQVRKPTKLLVQQSAEDELVAWTSVDTETRLRDQKLAAADQPALASPEWQKLEDAAGAKEKVPQPRNFKAKTNPVAHILGIGMPFAGEGERLPRALRRKQYQFDHIRRTRKKLSQSKQEPAE